MKKLFLSVVAVFVFSGLAMASITPALDGGAPTGGPGVWTWTYSISVDGNESLNPTANAGATCLGGQTPCNTFWTIYDVGGLITTTEGTPGGWGWVENAVGITPGGQLISDSGGYLNITFYYTGATQTGPITSIDGFSFQSTTGTANPNGIFSYQATKIQNGKPDQGQGNVDIPQSVPEPASVLLIGGGLVGLAFVRRKRSRQTDR
jgi:hypothetical protein